jgi:CheY-like chemotaxis protein
MYSVETEHLQILIVDDDADYRDTVRDALQSQTLATVKTASSYGEAFAMLDRQSYDILILAASQINNALLDRVRTFSATFTETALLLLVSSPSTGELRRLLKAKSHRSTGDWRETTHDAETLREYIVDMVELINEKRHRANHPEGILLNA